MPPGAIESVVLQHQPDLQLFEAEPIGKTFGIVKVDWLAANFCVRIAEGVERCSDLGWIQNQVSPCSQLEAVGVDASPEVITQFDDAWAGAFEFLDQHRLEHIGRIGRDPSITRQEELGPAVLPGRDVLFRLLAEPQAEHFSGRAR